LSWREAFVAEVIGFPGEFDDQVDAVTQYLDADPVVPPRPAPEHGGVIVFASRFRKR
jgi:hypothetical protein